MTSRSAAFPRASIDELSSLVGLTRKRIRTALTGVRLEREGSYSFVRMTPKVWERLMKAGAHAMTEREIDHFSAATEIAGGLGWQDDDSDDATAYELAVYQDSA